MNFLESNAECWLKLLSGEPTETGDIENEKDVGNDLSIAGSSAIKETISETISQTADDTDVILIGEGETDVIQISDDDTPSLKTTHIIKPGSKRPVSQCDDITFMKAIEAKLLKMDSTEKDRVKNEILKIFN